MPAQVQDLLRKAAELPSPPMVAQRMLDIARDEDFEVGDLVSILETDPALAGRVLKVANSAMFAGSGEVASLSQAVMVLGLRTVRMLTLSFSLVDASRRGTRFDHAAFWRNSATTAVACHVLASRFAPEAEDEAFVTGLLLDLGMLVSSQIWPQLYDEIAQIWERTRQPIEHYERRLLGTDHAEVGELLLREWGLPERTCHAIGRHHQPDAGTIEDDSEGRSLCQVAAIASRLAQCLRVEVSDGPEAIRTQLRTVSEWLEDAYGRSAAQRLEEVLEQVRAHVQEVATWFAIDGFEPTRLDAMLTEARHLGLELGVEVAARCERAEERAFELEKSQQSLQGSSRLDDLTGLLGKTELDRVLVESFLFAHKSVRPFGLLKIGLDRTRSINDRWGHGVGDRVLIEVGRAMSRWAGPREIVGRFAGDEFCVAFPSGDSAAFGKRAEELRALIERMLVPIHGGRSLRVNVSIGGVWADSAAGVPSVEHFLVVADRFLAKAKDRGGNRVVLTKLKGGASSG